MSPNRISFIVSALLLLTPGVAQAYVTPEEVLFSPGFTPPPTSRTAEQRVEAQRDAAAAHRAAGLEQLRQAAPNEQEVNGVTGSDPDFTDIREILDLLQQMDETENDYPAAPAEEELALPEDTNTGRSTQEERILERVRNRQETLHASGDVLETMHQGAPLSNTGPGLVVVGTSLLAGALFTIRRSAAMKAQITQ